MIVPLNNNPHFYSLYYYISLISKYLNIYHIATSNNKLEEQSELNYMLFGNFIYLFFN
jgi:hypothetical protein